jgi:L-lactate dehydrogenase complex protein LldG
VSDARERVLGRVRAALVGVADKRPLPDYPAEVAVARGGPQLSSPTSPAALAARFRAELTAARGLAFDDARALGAWLAGQGAARGYCDPALAPALGAAFGGAVALETTFARERVDDYRFGITRAAGAVAETGSIILDEGAGAAGGRLAALAPWIHVAVVAPARIHANVAVALAALGDGPYVTWCTGPSKTADVEGILIEGVHGPGEQVALLADI